MKEVFPEYEKLLLNKYLEYKGNIRVFVRVRPVLAIDYKAYGSEITQAITIPNQR